MRRALIVGSEGQDGTLLKQFLRQKNYQVFGIGRNDSFGEDLDDKFTFDLSVFEYDLLQKFIIKCRPDEIYYVAAFHHSSQQISNEDFGFIERSLRVNQVAFIHVMETCRIHLPSARIIYTSSSLIFSGSDCGLQNELTVTQPRCVYSISKCAAMEAAKYYRAAHGLFVSVAIMYNHESALRGDQFLSKRIINQTKLLLEKQIDVIHVGQLSAITDWGYAPDYVEALWHILQLEVPDVFIVSSGKGHMVQDWFEVLFGYLKMDWKQHVQEDPSLMIRRKGVLIGDNAKLLATGWKPKVSFDEMVIRIYKNIL